MAFKRFTRTASGMKMNEARKLYNAVAVPKITYATDLWFRPQKSSRTNRNPTGFGPALLTKRLQSIQCQAAISITGCLRTSPGDALIVHTNLVPIGVQLKETCLKTYAHLSSRPTAHPISHAMQRTAKNQVKRHRTALHHLAKSSRFNPANVEKIKPTRLRPGEYPDFVSPIATLSRTMSVTWFYNRLVPPAFVSRPASACGQAWAQWNTSQGMASTRPKVYFIIILQYIRPV